MLSYACKLSIRSNRYGAGKETLLLTLPGGWLQEFFSWLLFSGRPGVRESSILTIENTGHEVRQFQWCGLGDSNSWPLPWQGSALTTELNPHVVYMCYCIECYYEMQE